MLISTSYVFLHLHYYSLEVLLKCASITVQFMHVFELGLQQEMHAKGILMNPLRSKLLFETILLHRLINLFCVCLRKCSWGFLLHFEMALQPFLFAVPTWTSTQGSVTAGLNSKLSEVSEVTAVNTTISFGAELQFHYPWIITASSLHLF